MFNRSTYGKSNYSGGHFAYRKRYSSPYQNINSQPIVSFNKVGEVIDYLIDNYILSLQGDGILEAVSVVNEKGLVMGPLAECLENDFNDMTYSERNQYLPLKSSGLIEAINPYNENTTFNESDLIKFLDELYFSFSENNFYQLALRYNLPNPSYLSFLSVLDAYNERCFEEYLWFIYEDITVSSVSETEVVKKLLNLGISFDELKYYYLEYSFNILNQMLSKEGFVLVDSYTNEEVVGTYRWDDSLSCSLVPLT